MGFVTLEDVQRGLAEVLSLWRTMQSSDLEDAGADADRFQTAFYRFVDTVQGWVSGLNRRPEDVEAARNLPEIAELFDALPGPLQLPFETELEGILAGQTRRVDSTEQS